MGGLSRSGDWSSQLIGSEIPEEATLAPKFNDFLGSLTAHFPTSHRASLTGIWTGACATVCLRTCSVLDPTCIEG